MIKPNMTVVLGQPRGFCAGVERAINIVDRALQLYGPPIYVRHEIVHNKYVIDEMKSRGVIFIENQAMAPPGSVVIFSAHGVASAVEEQAAELSFKVLDATCPLVKRVHIEARAHEAEGRKIIMIGHAGHPEVEGTMGRVQSEVILVQNVEDVSRITTQNDDKLCYITQTTLSMDETKEIIAALKLRFPNIIGPELRNICYATQNRQDAVRKLAEEVDMILVIGSNNSSNSNQLRITALAAGVPSFLIDGPDSLPDSLFHSPPKILGLTAGASAPEILLQQVIDRLERNFLLKIKVQDGIQENMKFKLPAGL